MDPTPLTPRTHASAPARSAAPGRPAGWAVPLGALALILALVAAVHWPVLGAQATSMDDNEFLKNNPLVTNPGWASTSRFFSEVLRPSTVRGYYLPLSMTSLMVDYALGGRPDDLTVFHRTSLVLHLVNVALLVVLLQRLFGALLPAALAGLLFGLHPLTVEPVAWLGERKTLLAACFALGSMIAYVESTRRPGARWRVASLACFVLALLSKPTVTPLPLLLLLLDAWPLRRLSVRSALEKWPFVALSAVSAVITLISHERSAVLLPTTGEGLAHWPLHAAYLLAFYLGKILAPVDLTCVYPPPRPFTLANPVVAQGVAVVVAVAVALVALVRRTRGPLVGALFFVIAIAPTLGLVQYSWVIASDKYVYLPAVGLAMVAAAGIAALLTWRPAAAWRGLLVLPLVLVLGAEAYGVRATLRHWKDTKTLFLHMERFAPDAPAVVNGLALIAMAEGRPEDAIRHLRTSVTVVPGFADTRYNLGILLASRGDVPGALEQLQRASAIQPNDPDILGALGATLRASGRAPEAVEPLRQAVRLKPDFQPAVIALGQALVQSGAPAEGAIWLRRAADADPGNPGLRYELAAALLQSPGGTADAVAELRRALEAKPDWEPPLNSLAWVLATSPDPALRRPAEAVALAERAVRSTQSRRPEVLDTYAAALAAAGNTAEAARVAERAARLARDGHAEALAREIEGRLRLYRAGSAYVAPPEPARPSGS